MRRPTPDELTRMEAPFSRVFATVDPTAPFTREVSGRLLIFPVDYIRLDESVFTALRVAAKRQGSHDVYLASYIYPGGVWGDTYEHRIVDLGNYAAYASAAHDNATILEHLLFDPRGEWGLITVYESYALVGGKPDFVKCLSDAGGYDSIAALDALSEAMNILKPEVKSAWIDPLRVHLATAQP